MFSSDKKEQKKWDDGFKAGVAEVLNELDSAVEVTDLESPTTAWVQELSQKLSKKYV
jgi:hypothetical protein